MTLDIFVKIGNQWAAAGFAVIRSGYLLLGEDQPKK
jgi:hypothetical protein